MNNELKNHCEFFQSLSEHYTSRELIPRLNIRVQWSDRWDEMEQSTIICETGRLFEKIPLYVNDFETLSLYLINELIPRFEKWIKKGKPETEIEKERREAHEKLLCSFLYPTLLDDELDAYLEMLDGKPVITIRGEHHTNIPSYVTKDTWEEWLEDSLYWVRKWPKCVICGKKFKEEDTTKEYHNNKWEYTCKNCK